MTTTNEAFNKTTEIVKKTNKEIHKNCDSCGKEFIDRTRPKNRRSCSSECARVLKNAQERQKYREANPPKPTQCEVYYYDKYEYPFWNGEERIARNQFWKLSVPYSTDKIEAIVSARELSSYIGGRKRHAGQVTEYSGDEVGSRSLHVRYAEHSHKQAGEVTTVKTNREDIEKYLTETYGKRRRKGS